MSVHINEILDYLDAYPLGCYEGTLYSFMELLHDAYTEQNAIDSDEIHNIFRKLNGILDGLSSDEKEKLYISVCDLCREHEVLAFSHGLVAGMHLMTEVNYLP